MRACKVAEYTACIGGISLGVIFATTEAIASTTEIDVVSGFRVWMVTAILIAVMSICTALVVDRQDQIVDLLTTRSPEARAENDYGDIERRLRRNGSNITTLYPDEE